MVKISPTHPQNQISSEISPFRRKFPEGGGKTHKSLVLWQRGVWSQYRPQEIEHPASRREKTTTDTLAPSHCFPSSTDGLPPKCPWAYPPHAHYPWRHSLPMGAVPWGVPIAWLTVKKRFTVMDGEDGIGIYADDSGTDGHGKERCERWVWLAGLVALLSNPMAEGECPTCL